MAESSTNHTPPEGRQNSLSTEELIDRLSSERFHSWYQERKWRENIENGQPYFNGPGRVSDPIRHSPSQLLQCHRQMIYRQENAPAERPEPRGIFYFGTKFEEDLLFPFLNKAVTGSETYVRNSVWIDFTVETEVGELQIKGSTDPVIVDSEAIPVLPTEVKTKSSIDDIDKPNKHHRAQIHAYMVGLSKKFNQNYTDAVLVYGGRESLGLETFHVEFDTDFWENQVLDWAATHTQFRLDRTLPPANPEFEWECRFCSYRARCGKANTSHEDYGSSGLLPGYNQYPRESVTEYLEDNPEECLTPSLAREYPDLVPEYGVTDWYCNACDSEIDWREVDSGGSPLCPNCADQNEISTLTLAREKP